MGNAEFDILNGGIKRHKYLLCKTLLLNNDFVSLFNVFRGFVASRANVLLKYGGHGLPAFSVSDLERIFSTFVGKNSDSVEIKIPKFDLAFRISTKSNIWYYYFAFIGQIIRDNQYCVSSEVLKGKIIVDAGANVGIFSVFAAKLGAKKVYAFEPVSSVMLELKHNVTTNGLERVVIPVQKALGDKNERINIMLSDNFGGATMENSESKMFIASNRTGQEEVEVVRLDDFTDEKIGFIKMDVEGYEENVLVGASRTIKSNKPVLAFSAYHKPTDKTRLPEVLGGIRNDYKCVLHAIDEEVFYCD